MEKEPGSTAPVKMGGMPRVTWGGADSIAEAKRLLEEDQCVVVELPSGFNHTLFKHIHPDAPPSELEQLDVEGGSELLECVSGIKNLEQLQELADWVNRHQASVRIISPAPKIMILSQEA